MENQTIAFIPELTKQVEIGNKTMTRRLTGLEKVNISPDDFRFDSVDEKDANIYYFEELKVGEPTESYIIVRSKYRVGEIVNIESTDKKIQITGIRAERLQKISQTDAKSSGINFKEMYSSRIKLKYYYDYIKNTFIPPSSGRISANYSFQTLWRSIYGDNSWEANPWVWVYEFKIV